MSDRIEKSIEIAASVDRVWRALTDHREFSAWFGAEIDTPFAAGEVSTGRIDCGHGYVPWAAEIVAIEESKRFAWKWRPFAVDPTVDYSAEEPTLVEFFLEPSGAGTRLTVVESGFDKVPEHRRAEAFRMNDGGWNVQLSNVKAHAER